MSNRMDELLKEEKTQIVQSERRVKKTLNILNNFWWVSVVGFGISLIAQNSILVWVFIGVSLLFSTLGLLCSSYLMGYARGKLYQFLEERSKNDN